MMTQTDAEFRQERDRLNEIAVKYAGLGIKRFFSLDGQVYREGAWRAFQAWDELSHEER